MTRSRPLLLYLGICALYLLSGSSRMGGKDSAAMMAVTRSLYEHQWFDAGPCVPESHGNHCVAGVDGANYTAFGLVPSLAALPAYAAGSAAASLLHKDRDLLAGASMSQFNCLLTPLIAVLVAVWLTGLGYAWRVSAAVALTLAFATPLWHHGVKNFYSEPYFALALLAACWLLWKSPDSPRSALLAGLALGLACAARVYGAILFPILFWYCWRRTRSYSALAAFSGGTALLALAVAWFNTVRFGSPLLTGYHLAFPSASILLSHPLLDGLRQLFFHGEVGVLVFIPWIAAVPLFWLGFRRTHPDEALLAALLCAVNIVFFAKYIVWHGGWSYGPRLLIPILPFLALPLAAAYTARRSIASSALVALVAASFVIQTAGIVYPLSRYYNLESYYAARGTGPAWRGSLLIATFAELPELVSRTRVATTARAIPDAQRTEAYDAVILDARSYPTARDFLNSIPNAVNLTTPDLWLVKASLLGVPRVASVLLALLLTVSGIAAVTASLHQSKTEAPAPAVARAGAGV